MPQKILLDIDNTLIETARSRMTPESQKLWWALEELRITWGVELIGFTSRPRFTKFLTKLQLRRLGIRLDDLIMAKPRAQIYIGNRAVNFDCRYSSAEQAMMKIREVLAK